MTAKQNKKKRSNLIRFIRDVLEIDKWSFALSAFLGCFFAVASVVTTYLPKYFIDGILDKNLRLAVTVIIVYFTMKT